MESILIGSSNVASSRLVYGCMRIFGSGSPEDRAKGKAAIRSAIDEGITHFDHADIYGRGQCESLFAEVLKDIPGIREKILITSKCGIIPANVPEPGDPGRYDFSREHIITSVEASLKRLGVETLDFLLLHRPDYLFCADEVAGTFQEMITSGKVRHVGVSNFRPSQVTLLQSRCPFPLQVNQVEINIHNISTLLDGTLDQCQEKRMSPQAWCPIGGVAYPAWHNTFSPDDEQRIKNELDRQAETYRAENWVVMLAWLLKHPANILPIIGSTTPARIKAAKKALTLNYRREDWYRLLEARNGKPVP